MNYYLITIRSAFEEAMFTREFDYEQGLEIIYLMREQYFMEIRGFCLMPDYFTMITRSTNGIDTKVVRKLLGTCYKNNILKLAPEKCALRCVHMKDHRALKRNFARIQKSPVLAGIVGSAQHYKYRSTCLVN